MLSVCFEYEYIVLYIEHKYFYCVAFELSGLSRPPGLVFRFRFNNLRYGSEHFKTILCAQFLCRCNGSFVVFYVSVPITPFPMGSPGRDSLQIVIIVRILKFEQKKSILKGGNLALWQMGKMNNGDYLAYSPCLNTKHQSQSPCSWTSLFHCYFKKNICMQSVV